jgi:hypothetical protein
VWAFGRVGVSACTVAVIARTPHTRLIGSQQSKQQRDTGRGLSLCLVQKNPVWLEQRVGDQADDGGYRDEQGIADLQLEQDEKAT